MFRASGEGPSHRSRERAIWEGHPTTALRRSGAHKELDIPHALQRDERRGGAVALVDDNMNEPKYLQVVGYGESLGVDDD